ncbi:hypothetical protein OC845_006683, partial [Tilletia horrida]
RRQHPQTTSKSKSRKPGNALRPRSTEPATPADAAVAPTPAVVETGASVPTSSPPPQEQEQHQQQLPSQPVNDPMDLLQATDPGPAVLAGPDRVEQFSVGPSCEVNEEQLVMPATPVSAHADLPSIASLFPQTPSQAHATVATASSMQSPMLQTIARAQISIADEMDDEDEAQDGHQEVVRKMNNMSEKESRLLWLSTADALNFVAEQEDAAFITNEKKRSRVVRERYWRIVRDVAVFSQRTGIEVFLAAGRPDPATRGLKQHVFASAGLCNEDNKCMHDAANQMATIWMSTLDSYREQLIVSNKQKNALLQHQQARHLADRELIKEKDEALSAALATTLALRQEVERLRLIAAAAVHPILPDPVSCSTPSTSSGPEVLNTFQ